MPNKELETQDTDHFDRSVRARGSQERKRRREVATPEQEGQGTSEGHTPK